METKTEHRRILKGDRYIWGIYFCLCVISLVEIYSATSSLTFKLQDYFTPTLRHTFILFAGTIGVIIMHNFHYRFYNKLIPAVLVPLSIGLLLYTMLFGETINGAQRVISILGFPLQPSELGKMGVVMAVAYILAHNQTDRGVKPNTFKWIMLVIVPVCLLILPENLSTAVLLGGVCFCMMLIGRVEFKKLSSLVGLLVAFFVAFLLIAPHLPTDNKVFDRFHTWANRISNFSAGDERPAYLEKTVDANYQVHHARMAVANGGVFGVFPGNSRERDFLPQAYSDFIYAIIIEETGLIGGVAVILLYLALLIRAGMIAFKCKRAVPSFLIMGIAMIIVFQAMLHMAVAVGLGPVTGQPLPLVSRGGTNTLITCAYFGIMLSISRFGVAERPGGDAFDEEAAQAIKEYEATHEEAKNPLSSLPK